MTQRLLVRLVFGLLVCVGASAELVAQNTKRDAALRKRIEAFRTEQSIPGLSVAITWQGQMVLADGFGLADLENEVPARAETVYRLASISKAVTGVLAMKLVEQGVLDLDAEVQRYVPKFPVHEEGVLRVRHLLTHQGGIRHYRGAEILRHEPSRSLDAALAIFSADPLLCAPGTEYHYTTYGFTLLGCAMEHAAGVSFATLLKRELAEPLKLSTLRVDSNAAVIRHRAQGYVRDAKGDYANSALVDTSYKIPGGGLIASAPDAARLLVALGTDQVLGKKALETMFTPVPLADGKATGYALGWRVTQSDTKAREVWHTGAQQRVSTLLYGVPEEGLAVAIFCNLEGVKNLVALGRQLASMLR